VAIAPSVEVFAPVEVEPQSTPPPTTEMVLLGGARDGALTRMPPSPTTEIALLRDAQDALRSSPATALSLADEHAAHFAAGILSQEREVIAIEALIMVGRLDEARARAARLFRAVPRTAYRPRVQALLGEQFDDSIHNP